MPHWSALPTVESQEIWDSWKSTRSSWSEAAIVAGRIVREDGGVVDDIFSGVGCLCGCWIWVILTYLSNVGTGVENRQRGTYVESCVEPSFLGILSLAA